MSYSADLNLDEMTTSSNREYRRFKITEGTHLFRILPPFGTNHNGKASRQIGPIVWLCILNVRMTLRDIALSVSIRNR